LPGGKASAAIMEGAGIKLELLKISAGKKIKTGFAPAPQHPIPIGNKAAVFQIEDIKIASEELAARGILSSMIADVVGNKVNIFQKKTTV
jgi:hypothetical protein